MLPALLTRIEVRIAANTAAMPSLDRADRFMLGGLTDALTRYRDVAREGIDRLAVRVLVEVRLGPNWHGPAIDDLIRRSEQITSRLGDPHVHPHQTEAAGAATRLTHSREAA